MTEQQLMSIGGFAAQTGLSVPALRYYDEIELLEPASVDPSSGCRRYHRDQLAMARQIYILHGIEFADRGGRILFVNVGPDRLFSRGVPTGSDPRLCDERLSTCRAS